MRLGLDIGTNSIGWWLYKLKDGRPVDVIDSGVRIFSDGRVAKTGTSLARDRRVARAARRRRDRFLRRRTVLMQRLVKAGMMPADPAQAKKLEKLDPYALRAEGLVKKLPLIHFGRALFHLNQRRGFKLNRKTDLGDNESGKIKDATKRLDWAMADAIKDESKRTYGAFLNLRRTNKPEKPSTEQKLNKDESRTDDRRTSSVRTRLTIATRDNVENEKAGYDFYPDRRHLEEEFDKIWTTQASYHPEILTDTLHDTLFETIFYQRPLKAQTVGRCLFVDEPRLPKAHPLTQKRIMYETVNALRITAPGQSKRPLALDQRDVVIHALNGKKHTKSMSGMNLTLKSLGKTLKLRPNESFTLESIARDSIACDLTRASLTHPDRFGARWVKLSPNQQWTLFQRLRNDEDRAGLIDWLMAEYDLDEAHAAGTADAPLVNGYGRIGETATRNILEHLKADVLTYNQAVEACGWHHSDHRTGEVLKRLPYYGEILDRHVILGTQNPDDDDITRYGRITNPTVHIGLNQLRRIINRVIETYGKPAQIVVEMARELKQSADQKKKAQVEIKKNTNAAIKRGEKLVEELKLPDTGSNRMILRLWEELGSDPLTRLCPYTNERISAGMLFTGECEVDHILPYSRTLDDSFSNRTLCLREANREKRNKTPWEAWGNTQSWTKIEANLKNLADNKRWRFAPDAMERFEGEKGFLDRQLVDTQYLSRIARQYLDALYTEGGHVWVVSGRLTEMLRRHWGLNSLLPDHNHPTVKKKNRLDHRHHAIDAAVIAATDRSLVQKIAGMSKAGKDAGLVHFAASVPPPWDKFRTDVKTCLDQITVSHRANHGRIGSSTRDVGKDTTTTGSLHMDTAFGLTEEVSKKGQPLVVTRKPFETLKPAQIARTYPGKGGMIRDADLRWRLSGATTGKEGKDYDAALAAFAAKPGPYQGIRHVRLIESLSVAPIWNGLDKPTKAYVTRGNCRYEVWKLPNGKYTAWVVPNFYAHKADMPFDARPATPAACKRPHPAAQMILRLQKNDMVRLDDGLAGEIIVTIEKFSGNGIIEMIPHTESNAADRYLKDKTDNVYIRKTANTLIKANARRIYVDEIGHIRDPEPPSRL